MKEHITNLIIRWCHEKTAHSGRNMTLNEIRSSRYWVTSGNSVKKRLILKCATCQRLRGNVAEKIMANLPPERKKEEPSFTQCGVDMLSPFEINERRTTLKYSHACSHALCEGKTSFCMGLISRTLCRFLLMFSTGFTSFSIYLTSFSSIDHIFCLCAQFRILFHLT